MSYRLLRRAVDDLDAIDNYLVQNFGLEAADRTMDGLTAAFALLARFPNLGRTRPDVTERPVRFFAFEHHWIVYAGSNPVTIHRVYHGRRDLKRIGT